MRFVDSYKHLSSSLDSLVSSLLNKDTNIDSIKNKFSTLFEYYDDKQALKLLRKVVYPYDYMNKDWQKRLKQKELPDTKYFYSSLSNTKCSNEDYKYAKEISNYFKCKNIRDYNDLYVETDVFLLADVLASYRMKSNESSGIDPIHCISSPGLSDRTMLKLTNIKIRLITDRDAYLIIKKGIKGGRCEGIDYHAKANNKYLNSNFNKETDKESYIVSFDVNSLYPHAMMKIAIQ